jgi:uncharacterized membrane protein
MFSIFTQAGLLMVLRWFHLLAGVTWIGLLYYLNFVQGSFFAETDAATKSNAVQKLLPRVLWWFRWAAMVTFVIGVAYLGLSADVLVNSLSYRIPILIGAGLGTLMWANVWFIIWPCQKVVIASATQVAGGGTAIPEAAARAGRSAVASRTNVLFSIPVLFFMGATQHLGIHVDADANLMLLLIVMVVIIGALELNAIKGKTGPMTTIKGVIHCGFALTIVLYVIMEVLTKKM